MSKAREVLFLIEILEFCEEEFIGSASGIVCVFMDHCLVF
jgi:hypothetical protein